MVVVSSRGLEPHRTPMPSMLDYFKMRLSPGTRHKNQVFPCQMPYTLGLQLRLLKPTTAGKVFLVNNSPILSMLLHEKIFKVGSQAVKSAESPTEAQGQNIDALPEMEQPAEPTSETEEQNICELPQADESTSGEVEPALGAEEQEDQALEDKWPDWMSDTSSVYTFTVTILDKVLSSGGQHPIVNFGNFNCVSESENPIPPEYEAGTEFLNAALKQAPSPRPNTPSTADTRYQPHEDPLDFIKTRLTEKNLEKNRKACMPSIPILPRFYHFMKNPRHPDPCQMPYDRNGTPLGCWDGCPDCEVWPSDYGSRIWLVNNWFETYFTPHEMDMCDFLKNPSHPSLKYPEPDPNDDDDGNVTVDKREHDEDFLMGAEGPDDFPGFKWLYDNEPEDTHQDVVTLLAQYMQLWECIHADGGRYGFDYYYGERCNAIMNEYEPHVLPNVGFGAEDKMHVLRYPGIDDMSKPIWHTSGSPWPMQCDYNTRVEYTRKEYNRKMLMFRGQDEARQRYIQQVREAARYEYVQKGHVEEAQ
ncbi:uncharacterized protein BHQ10_001645 [Talaromyces amestolkiae]|uniref:Uncharacterized protein n=1 Tax=Talaromyces amestolkiae TaxID=1196081 RepID=A0A364KQ24_TALAM|nr:uncharacterized protein BHQ10_001645 [Talaromyces amestolkiae]RAO65633.1 hypothetical protein BHQ10_001645 [Talaromyces amestolkiae]